MFVARSPQGAAAAVNLCSICREDLATDEATLTSCGHEFHSKCLRQWCQTSNNCPNCRQEIRTSDPSTGAIPRRYNTRQAARQLPTGSPEAAAMPEPQQRRSRPASVATRSPEDFLGRTQPVARAEPRMNIAPQAPPHPTGSSATEALLATLRHQIIDAVRAEVARSRDSFHEEAVHSSPRLQQPSRQVSAATNGFQEWSAREGRNSFGIHQPPAFESTRPNPRVHQPERRGFPTGRRSASPMRRWNLLYDGDNSKLDVDEFIFRVETLTNNTLRGDFSLLVENLHALLGGRVDNWFWTLLRQSPSPPWEHVKLALKSDWGEHTNDVDIRRRMLGRRQRPNESFSSYCQDLIQLRNRLRAPMTEMEFVENVRMNLLPSIQEQICLHRTTSIAQLRALVHEVQTTRARIRSHMPTSTYTRSRLEEYYVPELLEYPEEQANAIAPEDYVAAVEQPRHQTAICWNCDQPGHFYTDCIEEPRGFFCYGCGKKGVVKPRCPSCSQKNFRRVEGNNSSPRPTATPRRPTERKDSTLSTNTPNYAPPRHQHPHSQ